MDVNDRCVLEQITIPGLTEIQENQSQSLVDLPQKTKFLTLNSHFFKSVWIGSRDERGFQVMIK